MRLGLEVVNIVIGSSVICENGDNSVGGCGGSSCSSSFFIAITFSAVGSGMHDGAVARNDMEC